MPREDIERVPMFAQMGLPQGLNGFFPSLLQFFHFVFFFGGEIFQLRFILLDDLLDEKLLPPSQPDLAQEKKANPQPEEDQNQEKSHPPGPFHPQNQPKNEQEYDEDRGDDQKNFEKLQQGFFHMRH